MQLPESKNILKTYEFLSSYILAFSKLSFEDQIIFCDLLNKLNNPKTLEVDKLIHAFTLKEILFPLKNNSSHNKKTEIIRTSLTRT